MTSEILMEVLRVQPITETFELTRFRQLKTGKGFYCVLCMRCSMNIEPQLLCYVHVRLRGV